MIAALREGAWVFWQRQGESGRLPAVVVTLSERYVKVRLPSAQGDPLERWVEPGSLQERRYPSSALNEPMRLGVGPFVLTAGRESAQTLPLVPWGLWHGEVDGYCCTGTCLSADEALQVAHRALTGGEYANRLLDDLASLHEQFGTDLDGNESLWRDVNLLRSRLLKLEGFDRAARSAA